MLIVSQHDQNVQVGFVQGFGQLGDALLVPLVPLFHLVSSDLLGDAVDVRPAQEVFIVGMDPVGADEHGVSLVTLAPG